MKKEKNKKTTKKKVIIIILSIILVIILAICIRIFESGDENIKVTATKSVSNESNENYNIKYKIKIKDYNAETIVKEIEFNTEEEAKDLYEQYQIINTYERKGIDARVEKKKVIVTMTEEQFKEDIEYDKDKDIIYVSKEGEEKKVLNQEEMINALIEQGYSIK